MLDTRTVHYNIF